MNDKEKSPHLPKFLDSSLLLKSKFYTMLNDRADGSGFFKFYLLPRAIFFMNHTLQFVKY